MDTIEMPEIWRDIIGYEGVYQVSTMGKIRSIARPGAKGKELTRCLNRTGYLRVTLCVKGIKSHFELHRLIGRTFIPNPDSKPCLNHKNGIKTDNRVGNLEWCTRSENAQHAVATGLLNYKNRNTARNIGSANGHSRKIAQFDLLGNKIKEYDCANEAARQTGICQTAIRQAARRNNGLKNRGKAGGYKWKFLAECNYIVKREAA